MTTIKEMFVEAWRWGINSRFVSVILLIVAACMFINSYSIFRSREKYDDPKKMYRHSMLSAWNGIAIVILAVVFFFVTI